MASVASGSFNAINSLTPVPPNAASAASAASTTRRVVDITSEIHAIPYNRGRDALYNRGRVARIISEAEVYRVHDLASMLNSENRMKRCGVPFDRDFCRKQFRSASWDGDRKKPSPEEVRFVFSAVLDALDTLN